MDCEKLMKAHKMIARSGERFGSEPNYVRISMLSNDTVFDDFLQRLSEIKAIDY